ncbi:MAG: HEAT repeat domain-containing protein [Bacteroidaceae bacterium]|nr:HEAT repeat domain-containing protein [Bacteroidaceae bacterium]
MKRIRLFVNSIIASVLFLSVVSCNKAIPGFAVIIDPASYNEAKAEIDRYCSLVESRGLYPYLVIDRWRQPDSIRTELIRLHNDKKHPIEGCVFIGDIPVVMVRDAQHFTTALKMDQYNPSFSRNEYCVPSDRFYDCFDLKFDLIEQDSARSEYFFYSLRGDCPQRLCPTIYSARIFPRDNETGNRYDKLRRYMQRVNEADNKNNPLDKMFYFSGEGYISESVDARIDEKIELYDQFPWMKKQKQSIEYIDHKREKFVKNRLMQQMQYKDIDFAILHHHGAFDTEYLSVYPDAETMVEDVAMMRRFMREQMREGNRKGMSKQEVMRRINNYFGCEVPESWYKGALDPEQIARDEQDDIDEENNINLHFSDFTYYHPQVRMVSLDGCYNGSFHRDESIQEGYLFGQGNGTIVVLANTVNVLQDKWADHFIGLMGLGMRAGHMAQFGAFMEQHLFGDPTFSFTPAVKTDFDVNDAINNANDGFWKKQLKDGYPAMQILALNRLRNSNRNYSDLIADKFKTSHSGIVRLAALMELSGYRDENFVECLALALDDSHEMTQRLAVNMAGRSGDERLIPGLVRIASKNNTSERIEFDVTNAFHTFDSTMVLNEFDKYYPTVDCYLNHDSIGGLIRNALHSFTTTIPTEVNTRLFDRTATQTQRKAGARALRNNPVHSMIPQLLELLDNPDEDDLILTVLWEAMGWYDLSYRAEEIASAALKTSTDERFSERVRNEALKTYNRTLK